MEATYNETDAAIYAHKNISLEMQKKYSIDQIEYLFDLVYECYESVDDETETDIMKILSYVNTNIKDNYCEPITLDELVQLLEADNLYMESIGLLTPEETDEDLVYIHNIINDVYMLLSDDLKKKYTKEDVYMIILIDWDYLEGNEDADETEEYKHIQEEMQNEGINISTEEIEEILTVVENFLVED
jgi:hypothetical protein